MAYADSKKASFVMTLAAAARSLLAAAPVPTVTGMKADAYDIPIRALIIQPLEGNTGKVFISTGDPNMSTTDYSFRLEIPVSSVPEAPFVLELMGQIKPSEMFLLGSVPGDKVSVGWIGF